MMLALHENECPNRASFPLCNDAAERIKTVQIKLCIIMLMGNYRYIDDFWKTIVQINITNKE